MALKACNECGKEVSTEARVCPNCGKKQQGLIDGELAMSLIVIVAIMGFVIILLYQQGWFDFLSSAKQDEPPVIEVNSPFFNVRATVRNMTPEQRAQVQRKLRETAEKGEKNCRVIMNQAARGGAMTRQEVNEYCAALWDWQ